MRSLSSSLIKLLSWCSYHARTAVLFTASDFKTILFPIVRLSLTANPGHPSACDPSQQQVRHRA